MIGRVVAVERISELIAGLCLEANFRARPDVKAKLEAALGADNSTAARTVLEQLVANIEIAADDRFPLCQDCGHVTVFAKVGQDVRIEGGLFDEAVQKGVADGYERGRLRRSIITDTLGGREVTETEREAKIYVELAHGDVLEFIVMPKGGGSDNAGRLKMMKPTGGEAEIADLVLETVTGAGVNACPPLFIGVGVGGSFDSVALNAKKALLRDFSQATDDPRERALEERLLTEVNALGIGPAGLGGTTTALGVSVMIEPAHIASLPVAVNISCNQLRSARGSL